MEEGSWEGKKGMGKERNMRQSELEDRLKKQEVAERRSQLGMEDEIGGCKKW